MAYTTIDKPSDYFNSILWSGNGTDGRGITGVGFQPDWVWVKNRNSTGWHNVFDAVRGVTKRIHTNSTSAEGTVAETLQSFDSDGFTVGTNSEVNFSGRTYVAWNWLASNTTASNTDGSITSTVSANTTSGFSIVKFTASGSGDQTVGHGLGVKPKMVITDRDWETSICV